MLLLPELGLVHFKYPYQAVRTPESLLELHLQVAQRITELRLDDILAGQSKAEPADSLDNQSHSLHHFSQGRRV